MTPNLCHLPLPPLPFCVSKSSFTLGGRSLASGVAAQSSAGTWKWLPGAGCWRQWCGLGATVWPVGNHAPRWLRGSHRAVSDVCPISLHLPVTLEPPGTGPVLCKPPAVPGHSGSSLGGRSFLGCWRQLLQLPCPPSAQLLQLGPVPFPPHLSCFRARLSWARLADLHAGGEVAPPPLVGTR